MIGGCESIIVYIIKQMYMYFLINSVFTIKQKRESDVEMYVGDCHMDTMESEKAKKISELQG